MCSGYGSDTIEVPAGQMVELSIYTRSTAGATFSVTDADSKASLVEGIEVIHGDANAVLPTHVELNAGKPFAGPLKLKVKADSKGSRFSTHNYMLVCGFKK